MPLSQPTNTDIQGPAGAIEFILETPGDAAELKGVAVICHPHPLHGGTMNNKVVTTLARGFRELGFSSLRFNFRGVGGTEGEHDHGRGEQEDLLAIIRWVSAHYPKLPVTLAGFSFGTYVALSVCNQTDIQKLILVAPPVHYPDYPVIKTSTPTLLIQGEKDDVVNPADVDAWVQRQSNSPAVVLFPNAGHFFHGRLVELRACIKDWMMS